MLQAERDFVNLAEAHMAQLRLVDFAPLAVEDGHSVPGPHVNDAQNSAQAQMVHDIKLAAQDVKARAIAVAARRCEMLFNKQLMTQLNDHVSLKINTDLLLALKTMDRLIGLYGAGLREIDPEFGQVGLTPASIHQEGLNDQIDQLARASVCPPLTDLQNGQNTERLDLELLQSEKNAAAQQLSDIIHTAPQQERTALNRLLNIAASQIFIPVAEAEQSCLTAGLDAKRDLSDGRYERVSQSSPAQIGLESLMATITDKALGTAHHTGRHISLSYDVGERSVSAVEATRISSRLDLIFSVLIEHSFDPSSKGSAALISITAEGANLEVTANGKVLPAEILSQYSDIMQQHKSGSGDTNMPNLVILSLTAQNSEQQIDVTPKNNLNSDSELLDYFDRDLVRDFTPHAVPSWDASMPGLGVDAEHDTWEQRI